MAGLRALQFDVGERRAGAPEFARFYVAQVAASELTSYGR